MEEAQGRILWQVEGGPDEFSDRPVTSSQLPERASSVGERLQDLRYQNILERPQLLLGLGGRPLQPPQLHAQVFVQEVS